LSKKSPEQVSYNMSRIKNKDSVIENLLRKELWKTGLRYRKNYGKVTGKPDIAFPGVKVAVFCDSEFWHGFGWNDDKKKEFKTNSEFWINKIERNICRDREVTELLEQEGWVVLRFWGKEIKNNTNECVSKIVNTVNNRKIKQLEERE